MYVTERPKDHKAAGSGRPSRGKLFDGDEDKVEQEKQEGKDMGLWSSFY